VSVKEVHIIFQGLEMIPYHTIISLKEPNLLTLPETMTCKLTILSKDSCGRKPVGSNGLFALANKTQFKNQTSV